MTEKEFCSLSLDDNFDDLNYLDEYIEDETLGGILSKV